MKRKSVNTGDIALPALFIALVAALWEAGVWLFNIPPYILPPPTAVLKTLADTIGLLQPHVAATLVEAAAGFAIAIVLAFFLALAMDSIPIVKRTVYPLAVASQTIPIISVAPLMIIWFGYGVLPKVIVVVLVCFFPVLISLLGGLASVDPELLDLFRSMKATRLQTFRMVKLPAAMPGLFSGLKISASYSIMGAVIGEWLGAKEGLGYYMTLAQRSFYVDRVFAAILVITVLSLLVFQLVRAAERWLVPWDRSNG